MTVVILAACAAAFGILIGVVLLTDRPDDEHSLDASRRRHPSTNIPTHVHRLDQAPPYDQDRDP